MGSKFLVSLIAAAATAAPAIAQAAQPRGTYVYREDELRSTPPAAAIGPGTILYFNRAAATYAPGPNDSRQNLSTVPIESTSLSAWSCGDDKWRELMTCVRAMYSPFNVLVTDLDPGNTPHIETHVGGVPGAMRTRESPDGLPCNQAEGCVGGIAPLGCNGGIDNAITFVFSDAPFYNCNVQVLCETVAQESAHAFGLDHEQHCPDPMTYQQGCGPKQFRDFNAPCGEFENQQSRACLCPGTGSSQNSYQMLLDLFGPAASQPNEAPSCTVTAPASGATVTAGFGITVTASDDTSIARVELWIDGQMVTFKSTAPFAFSAPSSLLPGTHNVEARALDVAGLEDRSNVTVILGQPQACRSLEECPSGQTCVNGGCVLIPDGPGEAGSPCAADGHCLSGRCEDSLCAADPANGAEPRTITGGCTLVARRRPSAPRAGLVLVLGLAMGALVRRRRR